MNPYRDVTKKTVYKWWQQLLCFHRTRSISEYELQDLREAGKKTSKLEALNAVTFTHKITHICSRCNKHIWSITDLYVNKYDLPL